MRTLSKARQIFLYAAPFPALAFFKIWASLGRSPESLFVAACCMFVYCACVVALARWWDKPTYFDWAVGAYFLMMTLFLGLWPDASALIATEYAVTGIYICLFAAAFVPPLLGFDPFTYHYAKKYVPQSFWTTLAFVSINRIMTFAWAGLFAVCVLLSLYPSVVTRAIIPLCLIIGVGLPFNFRFPDYYLRRAGLPTIAAMRRHASPVSLDSASSPSRLGDSPARVNEFTPRNTNHRAGSVRDSEPITPSPLKRRTTMKVIALNSSARSEGISKTRLMLEALVKGMVEAGAEVEIIHLRDKKVKHCLGCFTCWTKTPGICVIKDDMTDEIFPKWLKADLAVYATPLYHYTVNATMKAFIERTLPVIEPFMVRESGLTHHPLRHQPPKAVFLSVAGFSESSVFDHLRSYVTLLFGKGLLAEIYRPAAEGMVQPEFREKMNDILDATVQAGRELVESMKISEPTMERITQTLGADFDSQAKMANAFWKTCIKEGVTPREFTEKGMIPRPDSIDTFLMIMSSGFNPKSAAAISAVLQFNFSGEVEGSCYLRIENGKIEAREGTSEKPDLVVETPFEIWMDIITGKADGQQMFMQQKYKTIGDIALLLRMKDLFGKHD
jgi:multimeric flavodoxin WrbA/putative sterol carrier protein